MKPIVKYAVLLSLPLWLAGCSFQAKQYDVTTLLPESYGGLVQEDGARLVSEPERVWWAKFELPELDALIAELSAGSYDLEIARQRVLRAQALLGQKKAGNLPTLDVSVDGTRTISQRPAPGQDNIIDSGQLGFQAAYEVDLWGKRAADNYVSELELVAAQTDFRGVSLSLQAQLVQQYFDLLSFQDQITATKKNMEATEELLRLVELQFEAGRASGVELNQQRNILLEQRGKLLTLQRDRSVAEHALAVLLGRDQLLNVDVSARLDDAAIPVVDAVQPASLLEVRPDIVIAEAQLKQNDAIVYQNKAKRWPTLNLSAESIYSDIVIGSPSWTTTLIGSLAAPLFDGGRITNEVKASEADASIALQTYRLTVIKAIQEVLDTLTDLNHQQEIYVVRQDELATSETLYKLARQRYDAGNIDFINLLDAERELFDATERVIQAKRDYLTSIVNAYKAMGVPPTLSENTKIIKEEKS